MGRGQGHQAQDPVALPAVAVAAHVGPRHQAAPAVGQQQKGPVRAEPGGDGVPQFLCIARLAVVADELGRIVSEPPDLVPGVHIVVVRDPVEEKVPPVLFGLEGVVAVDEDQEGLVGAGFVFREQPPFIFCPGQCPSGGPGWQRCGTGGPVRMEQGVQARPRRPEGSRQARCIDDGRPARIGPGAAGGVGAQQGQGCAGGEGCCEGADDLGGGQARRHPDPHGADESPVIAAGFSEDGGVVDEFNSYSPVQRVGRYGNADAGGGLQGAPFRADDRFGGSARWGQLERRCLAHGVGRNQEKCCKGKDAQGDEHAGACTVDGVRQGLSRVHGIPFLQFQIRANQRPPVPGIV